LDKVHCIMPSEEVSVSAMAVPAMSPGDAAKVIRRRLIKDTGDPSPLFNSIPQGRGGERQSYLVESIKPQAMERLVSFFRGRGIVVKAVTTALPANLRAIKNVQGASSQTIALIDIENDFIEMTVLSDHVISYGKAAILPLDVEKELESGKTPERIQKMRVFRAVESVYNAQSDYKRDFPDAPINKLWVCGTGSSLGGVLEALGESMNIETLSLNTFKEPVADGFLYTALHGFALGMQDGTAVDFLPRDLLRDLPFTAWGRPALITAGCVYAMIFFTVIGALEIKHRKINNVLEDKIRAAQQRRLESADAAVYQKHGATLKGLLARRISWRAVFGYLADNTPEGAYIEGLSLKQQPNGSLLDIVFVIPAYAEVGVTKYLTRTIDMIDRSGFLRRTGEPGITLSKRGKNKLLLFTVTCEVLSLEKKK
jgi:hypothetical protein